MSSPGTSGERPEKKIGRPSKGARHPRLLRFKLKVNAALERAAAAEGKSVQDYLDAIVEEKVAPFMEEEEEDRLMTV